MTLKLQSIKRILLVALGLLSFTALGIFVLQPKKDMCAPSSIQTHLQQEHEQIMLAIKDEFSIDTQAWNQTMKEFDQIRSNADLLSTSPSYKKSRDPLTNRIQGLLADAGINPDKIKIHYVENKGCPLLAVQEADTNNRVFHSIHIDREWLEARPQETQNAIMKHEIVHLKNFDSVEGGMIIDLVLAQGYTRDDYEASAAVQAYRHHRELRADLLAGATDLDTAKALQADFAECIAKHYHEDLSTHPSSETRHEKMSALINQMQNDNQLKLA